MKKVWKKLLAAAGMTAALVSTSGCMVSIQFDRSKRQLPQKLSSSDEKTWAAEPVWVSSGEVGVLAKESQAFESEFEPESEKESESEQGTAKMTEKESESPDRKYNSRQLCNSYAAAGRLIRSQRIG